MTPSSNQNSDSMSRLLYRSQGNTYPDRAAKDDGGGVFTDSDAGRLTPTGARIGTGLGITTIRRLERADSPLSTAPLAPTASSPHTA